MATVFLSSTGKDLHAHREAAYAAIEGLDGFHCVRMEDFGAHDEDTDKFCRRLAAECDVFVGIAGHCYGGVHAASGKSYTEREYDAACDNGKPRLMFLAPENFSLPYNLIENEERRKKQAELRVRVNNDRIRDTFTSPEDLARRVVQAIRNWESQKRNTPKDRGDSSYVTFLPLPPLPYFAHPYPMQPNFTGRINERRALTNWFMKDDRTVRVVEAIGGMGKSALTWAWVQRDLLGFPLPGTSADPAPDCRVPDSERPAGVFWWSFYEQNASFPKFLEEALRYVSRGRFIPSEFPSDYERAKALFCLLSTDRYLLVLDGFERELMAYATLNAAYVGDTITEDAREEFRRCINPHAGAFLAWLASGTISSRVLITSRLFPRALEGHDGRPLCGCSRDELKELCPDDAMLFFHAEGIKGTAAEIIQACADFGYHSLTLRLLCGMILNDPARPGDISVAPKCNPVAELKSREYLILSLSYDACSVTARELLSRIAAFRSPVDYATVKATNPDLEERQLGGALNELRDRGLLFRLEMNNRFDLHPIVRKYAYDRLTDKEGTHTKLRDYFSAIERPMTITTLDDLLPTVELYHHTVRAGQFDEAWALFHNRLMNPLYYQLGDYSIVIELLTALFSDGEDKPPRLTFKTEQVWLLNALANSYAVSGQSRRALQLYGLRISLDSSEDNVPIAVIRRNMADTQRLLGLLQEAEKNIRLSLTVVERANNIFDEANGHRTLHLVLGLRDKLSFRVIEEADNALRLFLKANMSKGLEQVYAYKAHITLLSGNAQSAMSLLKESEYFWTKEAAEHFARERDRVRIEWLFGWAKTGLAVEDKENRQTLMNEAEAHLTDALTSCRRINLVEMEGDILLAWSRWHFAKGDIPEAFKAAEEALEIADRCEYRLQQADLHNMLAKLYLAKGDRKLAKEHAEIGLERAYCDGPGYHYQSAYDEAERLLKEIGD